MIFPKYMIVPPRRSKIPGIRNQALFKLSILKYCNLFIKYKSYSIYSQSNSTPQKENKRALIRSIAGVLRREDLQDAVIRSTGDRARLYLRIKLMVEALINNGLDVDIPKNLKL